MLLIAATRADAAVVEYLNYTAWTSAAGTHTTLDFTDYPQGTVVTTQYRSLGITFTDGNEQIVFSSSFVEDNWGLHGWLDDTITVTFDSPHYTIAAHYPGDLRFSLYSGGTLFYVGGLGPGGGVGFFKGYVSTQAFDRVVMHDPFGIAFIDNLYFGQPSPGPCADLNGDRVVNGLDLMVLLGYWSSPSGSTCTITTCLADLSGDWTVNGRDLAILLGQWGQCAP